MPRIDLGAGGGIAGGGSGSFTWEKQLSDYGFTNTGDVTAALTTILTGLAPGTTLELEPWEVYQISDQIDIGVLSDVTINANDACLQITGVFNKAIVKIGDDAANVTINDLRIFGNRATEAFGSTLVDAAGNMARLQTSATGFITALTDDWAAETNTGFDNAGGVVLESDPNALRLYSLAAGDASIITATGKRYPAVAAVSYTSEFSVTSAGYTGTHFSRAVRLELVFYNSAGTVLQTSAGTPIDSPITGTNVWSQATVTATSPANTAWVGVRVVVAANAGPEVHFFDRFILKRATAPANAVVSTTKVLASSGDAVQIVGATIGRQQFWARRPDGTNRWGFTLSGSAAQTNGALVRIFDLRSGSQVHVEYMNVTTTPTLNYIDWTPIDIEAPYQIQIQNASTSTPITVTVASSYEFGRVAYNAGGDNMSGVTITDRATNIRLNNFHAEGVYGDAFEVTGRGVRGVQVQTALSRANMRQGCSVNLGEQIVLENVDIIGCGRSGLDIEPYGSDWRVKHLTVTNMRVAYVVNSAIAASNWHLIEDLTMTNVIGVDCGGGLLGGGCNGGSFDNVRHIVTSLSGSAMDCQIVGRNMRGTIHAGRGVTLGSTDGQVIADSNGHRTTIYPHSNPELRVIPGTVGGTYFGYISAFTDNDGIPQTLQGTILDNHSDPVLASATAIAYSGIIRADDPNTPMLGFDPGPVKRLWPQSFKGPIMRNMHYLGGRDLKNETVRRTRGLSATATRANNLRGTGVAVTTSATSLAVTFPGLGVSPVASYDSATPAVGSPAGTLAGTYYYRFAEILERGRGPSIPSAAGAVTVTAPNDTVRHIFKGLVRASNNGGHGYLPWGFTVFRGPSATSFDTQFDFVPTVEFPSLNNGSILVTDVGANLTFIPSGQTDREWGWPTTVPAVAHTGNVVDQSGWEPDVSYGVQITPSWSTTCWVTAKARGGFTINFGTAAPSGGTVDWFLVR